MVWWRKEKLASFKYQHLCRADLGSMWITVEANVSSKYEKTELELFSTSYFKKHGRLWVWYYNWISCQTLKYRNELPTATTALYRCCSA